MGKVDTNSKARRRQRFSGLAAAGLLLAAGTASAQSNCTASALNTPIVRNEGLAERVGSIVITCLAHAGAAAQEGSFTVTTDGPVITNSITSGTSSSPPILTTATLRPVLNGVDQPATAGELSTSNAKQLTFANVRLPFDASSGQLVVRIDNLRVNAQGAVAGSAVNVTVTANSVDTVNATTHSLLSGAVVPVAMVQRGLVFEADVFSLSSCRAAQGLL